MFTGFSFGNMPSLSRLFSPEVVAKAEQAYNEGIAQNKQASQEYMPTQAQVAPEGNSMFDGYVEVQAPRVQYDPSFRGDSNRFMGNRNFEEFLTNNLYHPDLGLNYAEDSKYHNPMIKTSSGYLVDSRLLNRLPKGDPHFDKILGMVKKENA